MVPSESLVGQVIGKTFFGRESGFRVTPCDFGKKDIGRSQQVDLPAKAVEELTEDEFGAGIYMNKTFGNAELCADEPAQRRRISFCVVIALRQLCPGCRDGLVNRRQRVFAKQEFNAMERSPAFFLCRHDGSWKQIGLTLLVVFTPF